MCAHCTMTTIAQIAKVPFCPKLLKNISAIGWPMGLFMIAFRSVPMQNARAMLIAHPRTPAIPMAYTMAHGTAVAAFEASSLMWTLESKEPT